MSRTSWQLVLCDASQLPAIYSGNSCDRLVGATGLTENIHLETKDLRIRACKQIMTAS